MYDRIWKHHVRDQSGRSFSKVEVSSTISPVAPEGGEPGRRLVQTANATQRSVGHASSSAQSRSDATGDALSGEVTATAGAGTERVTLRINRTRMGS
jgi:hypothetical protein